MSRFTYITTYFNQSEVLREHVENWERFPPDWDIIVVDDYSDTIPLAEVTNSRVKLYRVTEDLGFNNHGARNLGAYMAKFGWLHITDLDHWMEPEDAYKLSRFPLNPYYYYNYKRYQNGKYKPHPNTFLVHRHNYWLVGGYDEDYCGTYGGDGQFRKQLDKVLNDQTLDITLREIPEAATNVDKKGTPAHEEFHNRLNQKIDNWWTIPNTPLRFSWERIK